MLLVAITGHAACCQAAALAAPLESVELRELPLNGTISAYPVRLGDLVRKYRKTQNVDLLLYVWEADAAWSSPVQDAFVADLKQLNDADSGRAAISLVTVYGTQAEKLQVYQSIQRALSKVQISIPTLVDADGQLPATLEQKLGVRFLYLPELVLIDTGNLSIFDHRGTAPIGAGLWAMLLRNGAKPEQADPEGIPQDCKASWFRRAIALVVREGIIHLDKGQFFPEREVKGSEFHRWLTNTSAGYEKALLEYDDTPIQRQHAIAATVKAVYGDDPTGVLAALPGPTGEDTQQRPLSSWQQAFKYLPGSDNVAPRFRPYLGLALASGVLHSQTSLHAEWPLTREEAAWLLASIIVRTRAEQSGVVIDARKVPFEQDLRFMNVRLSTREEGSSGKHQFYPQASGEHVPAHVDSYPVALCARQGRTLQERVGRSPLQVTATGVGGAWANANELVVSPEDAEAIIGANRRWGILDFWRVAVLTDPISLVSPTGSPVPRDTECVIRLGKQVDSQSISEQTLWLQAVASGERVPAAITQDRSDKQSWHLKPTSRLSPATEYALVLANNIRTTSGDQLEPDPGLPEGTLRRFTFATENTIYVEPWLTDVAAGSSVFVNDVSIGTAPGPLHQVSVAPGSELQVRVVDPSGVTRSISARAVSDGRLEMRFAPPEPSKVLVLPPSDTLDVGQTARIKVQVLDERGMPMAHHTPVTLKVHASAGVSAPESMQVTADSEFLDVVLSRPGIASLDFESEASKIPISGNHVELRCRAGRATPKLEWSRTERHRVGRRPGDGVAAVVPSLSTWFAEATDGRVSVVDVDGVELIAADALPSRNAFVIDRGGACIRFHESNLGRMVDVRYEYHPILSALVTLAQPEDRAVSTHVERAAEQILTSAGCALCPSSEVSSVIGGDSQKTDLTSSELQMIVDLLRVDALFAVDVRRLQSGEHLLVLAVHTADSENTPLRGLARSQSQALPADAARDERALHAAVQQLVGKWLASVGLTPSPTLVRAR
jgi:hypothetical protein